MYEAQGYPRLRQEAFGMQVHAAHGIKSKRNSNREGAPAMKKPSTDSRPSIYETVMDTREEK